jgi:hypothetical protein
MNWAERLPRSAAFSIRFDRLNVVLRNANRDKDTFEEAEFARQAQNALVAPVIENDGNF